VVTDYRPSRAGKGGRLKVVRGQRSMGRVQRGRELTAPSRGRRCLRKEFLAWESEVKTKRPKRAPC